MGGASFCLDTANEYVRSRKQFGKPLADLQNIQFKLADMATDLTASRLMVRNAARMMDEDVSFIKRLRNLNNISTLKKLCTLLWLKDSPLTNVSM